MSFEECQAEVGKYQLSRQVQVWNLSARATYFIGIMFGRYGQGDQEYESACEGPSLSIGEDGSDKQSIIFILYIFPG